LTAEQTDRGRNLILKSVYLQMFLTLIEKWLKSEFWRCVCVFCALEKVDAKWVLNLMSIFVSSEKIGVLTHFSKTLTHPY
jgi:hypothetical protein